MLTPVSSTVTPITLTSGIGIGILVDTTGKPLPGTKMVLGVFEGMAQPSTDIIGQTGENGVIEKWTYRVAGFKFSIIKDPNNDSKYSQTTDEKGTFRIEDVPPGDYVLLAEEFRFPMPDFTLLPVKSGVSSYIVRIEAGKVYDLGEIDVSQGIKCPH
jgi:hypothetical protein